MKTIKQLREERGWTQLQLAIKIDSTPTTIFSWEHETYEPSATNLRKLARAFGVSMDEIEIPERVAGRRRNEPRS